MKAPLPPDELQRLDALRKYGLLDITPELAFDRVTRLAAKLLQLPMAVVALAQESRRWFKPALAFPGEESRLEDELCSHAILCEKIVVIEDTAVDGRFAGGHQARGESAIRFFAGAPLKSENGLRLGALCVMGPPPSQWTAKEEELLIDLAALASEELELRRAAFEGAQQAAIVANLRSGVVLSDPNLPDNPVIFSNPGFSAMSGYSMEEMAGLNCRFMQGPGTDPKAVEALRRAIAERSSFHGMFLNYRKDGVPFWNELTVNPIFNSEGKVVNFVGLQTDVTERKRLADQLQESLDKLKALETLRDNLTHMIVHDLRSPLTALLGYHELIQLAGAGKLGPDEAKFLDQATASAREIQKMITSLLDVSRLEAGEMPVDAQPADLFQIIRSLAEPYLAAGGSRAFLLNLPVEPALIKCDADLIRRVMANLISNAVKFTPADGEIVILAIASGAMLKVSVKDTGGGIPLDQQGRIFEKFGQVDGRKHRHSTGLGLTFCKLAVEAHGGRIGVESSPGKGSTFWFELPLGY